MSMLTWLPGKVLTLLCWSHWRDMTMVGTVYCTNSTSSVGSVSANASQRGFMRLLLWNFRSAQASHWGHFLLCAGSSTE